MSVAESGTESEYKQSICYLSHPRDGCNRQISVITHGRKRYSVGDAMCTGLDTASRRR